MKWQEHTFEEARHPQSGRKAWHCTTCDQYWTGRVGVDCPGVPVLRAHHERYATKTQLARDRLFPPDEEQPDAAYRIQNAPYYGFLYDREKALSRPLTRGQITGNQKREATIKQRYGCCFCSQRYTKKHHDEIGFFEHGTCRTCRHHIQRWNELTAQALAIKEQDTFIIQVTTLEERPLVRGGLPEYTVTDIEVWPLSTETPVIEAGTPLKDAHTMLRFYLDSAGLNLLFPCTVDAELAYRWLYPGWNFWENPKFQYFQTLRFGHDLAYPLLGKDWNILKEHDYYQPKAAPAYYRDLAALFELEREEPLVPAHVMRQIVLSLAEQAPLVFP